MRYLALILLALALAACQTQPPKDGGTISSIRQSLAEADQDARSRPKAPPPEVTASLMPPMTVSLGGGKRVTDKRFDVNVNGLAAREFFMSLVDGTPYNMVIHPQVAGEVSLVLKNVTIPEVMQVMRDVYGYEYERNSSGFYVLPLRLQTRIYQVNYLNVRRSGNSQMRVSSGQVSETRNSDATGGSTSNTSSSETLPSTQVVTESDADFWTELKLALDALVGSVDGRSVVVSPQSGVVVVRAMPGELREVEDFLHATQATLQRQVILEAKIMEVILRDGFQSGIEWSKIFGGSDTVAVGLQGADLVASNGGIFSVGVDTGSFTALIELLSTQGNVQILSSPRVSTVNNQKAVIKVGQDEFFVTDVSATTVTGTATSTTPEVTLTPFFSGIALDVTPQIDHQGGVTLHIHPSVSEVTEQDKVFTIADTIQELPLAQSTIRESDNIVYAVSGQIVVIGGLMQETVIEEVASAPGLGDIPFLGAAFRQTEQSARKSELVILLKPLVVDSPKAWADSLAGSARSIDRLDRGFHVGGSPRVFGTEGEVR
ncbi:MAG: secretin N-terminal domain-containing protein [Gammaproteobacteria bacterium]|nr:secretin N-terminal domain-containing protein [Gammaproteobacteria bacterium]